MQMSGPLWPVTASERGRSRGRTPNLLTNVAVPGDQESRLRKAQKIAYPLLAALRGRLRRSALNSPTSKNHPPQSYRVGTIPQQTRRLLAGRCSQAGSADRRFCGPRLFSRHHRHRAIFYRGVETPGSLPFRFLHRRAPPQTAREIHRA